MAQYTVLHATELETILCYYGIKTIKSYQVLSGGSENTNYLVNTLTKKYVLTICEQKSPEEANQLASLLIYLYDNNFSTSRLIKTSEDLLITTWNSKPVMLKEYIDGDIIQDLSNELLVYLGRELAKLHTIKPLEFLPKKVGYGIEHFDEVTIYAPQSSFYMWLKKTQQYIEGYISDELPKSLIHSDIFYNNIIVDTTKKQATIMDFEEACYYYRIFDIGMMIIGTCCIHRTIDLEKVTHLLKGYQQEITLLDIEKEALQAFTAYGATATAFWRHQNFNYTNVTESKKDHYKEMQDIATHIISIPEITFKNCLG